VVVAETTWLTIGLEVVSVDDTNVVVKLLGGSVEVDVADASTSSNVRELEPVVAVVVV
jgi:hypothetical protein